MTAAIPAGGQDRVRAEIAGSVRVRFALSAEQLAERVIALARAAGVPPVDFARRLLLDDLYLATACAEGDERAWAECEAVHFAFIREFAQRFLSDVAARDLADQVIADLWQRRKIARYEGRSTLRTWLGALVAHAAINAGRSTRTFLPLDSPASADAASVAGRGEAVDPARLESARALRTIVTQSVDALPANDKLLLQLYYEQGLTLDVMELATRLSRATLSRRLSAIRARLRADIDDRARREVGSTAEALRRDAEPEALELDLSQVLRAKPR